MKLTVKPYPGKLGIAVSGGMDSMVLLHLFAKVQKNIVVINVEHGIRGEESVSDSHFVESYCRLLGIECLCFSVKTLEEMKQGESVELAARRLRYEIFDRILAEKKVDAIALAHHADDNAETVLMRIFRGTGVRGLIGMGERKGYIRPLLCYAHKDIEEYAQTNGISYVTDSTNLVDDCTRNYVRHEILPKIKALYPGVTEAFVRLSENAKEVDEYLYSLAPSFEKNGFDYIMKDCFTYPAIVQKYALRKFFEEVGIFQDVEKTHYDAVPLLSHKPNNTVTGLPFGYRCLRRGKDLIITNTTGQYFKKTPFNSTKTYEFFQKKYSFEKADTIEKGVTLDITKIPDGACIRTRLDGDTFHRVNGKNKLLSDFLNDKKLTAFEKERLLLLTDGGNVVLAVLGLETAESVKGEGGQYYHIVVRS